MSGHFSEESVLGFSLVILLTVHCEFLIQDFFFSYSLSFLKAMHCDFDFICLFATNAALKCLNLEYNQLTFSVNVPAS